LILAICFEGCDLGEVKKLSKRHLKRKGEALGFAMMAAKPRHHK
jgi:hypothetical protein